ncbi:hypothetical protein QE416_001513 [Microbacterium sp. SORGH_AS 421]|nr:hypothetical protein [Microbacterium sp. SORGH_AS_0421]
MVEAESVDVHLEHPVTQRIHDQLQRVGVAHVHAVAGAGVVGVVALVVVFEAVVRLVVDAAHRQGRAHVVALGGVVVDHVEDDLDAGGVQSLDHGLELLHLLTVVAGRGVGVLRGEERDGVVAPVVRQPLLFEGGVVDELVHRHELDRGDAELLEVLDDGGVGDAGVRATQLLGYVGVQLGEAAHVGLVDERLGVGDLRLAVARPVEERVDDDALHHVGGGVLVVERVGVAELVAEDRLPPVDLALDGLRVRVEEQLRGVEALAVRGVVLPVHAVAVALPRLDVGEVGVPDERVDVDQLEARLRSVFLEEAELDLLCSFTEQGEVRPVTVVSGPEGITGSWPYLLHVAHDRPALFPRTAAMTPVDRRSTPD